MFDKHTAVHRDAAQRGEKTCCDPRSDLARTAAAQNRVAFQGIKVHQLTRPSRNDAFTAVKVCGRPTKSRNDEAFNICMFITIGPMKKL